MKATDCFYIGYFSKTIGNKGDIGLQLDVDDPSRYHKLESVFIQINKKDKMLVPFFISQFKLNPSNIARLKLEGIDHISESKSLVGASVFLPLSMLPPLSGNQFYYHEVKDFQVKDQNFGPIGHVDEVLEHTTQAILQIIHPTEKEILIPISDVTIVSIDRNKKELIVNAPEGLIDLYLD